MADEVTMQGDLVVMRDEKVGTGPECCCLPCDQADHCVTAEWDWEYLVNCTVDPKIYQAGSGSAVFFLSPDGFEFSALVCLDGLPVADDSAYRGEGFWDIPTGGTFPTRFGYAFTGDPVNCSVFQVLPISEFGTGLEWPAFDGTYNEITEDLSGGGGGCTADEVVLRGMLTITDVWPSTAEACGCP